MSHQLYAYFKNVKVVFMHNTHRHVVKMPFSAGTKQYVAQLAKLWFITSTY